MAETSPKAPLDSCSPEEIQAWEAWANGERFDMGEHSLHYLFLDKRTAAARKGWKAGLAFARQHADAERARREAKAAEAVAELRSARFRHEQATKCAGCGQLKHTPLCIGEMGGYVCLTCIDKRLTGLLAKEARHADLPAVGSFHG